ncbi:hypothetical protein B0H12DRAFT_1090096 [Mycena haematopus]|nr:hypothetical protein B0H12DRAFT_1090096 [Mycena haematopus]
MSHSQTLGAGDALGAGDSYLTLDVLPAELAADAFERLRDEVKWDVMHHRGGEVPRLVAVEGLVGADGSIPIYRHPADESPPLHAFSPTVEAIRQQVEKALPHPVNHVLIQLYRTGTDYISEHSDKTIDVVRGSYIVNVSLGAQRTMTLRKKRDDTNAQWLHGIRQDNRLITLKAPAEVGERISLTFRHIGTFLSADQRLIWGQGATGKTREAANAVVHGGEDSERLVAAFGAENHRSDFVWEDHYGRGFDVVNFTTK